MISHTPWLSSSLYPPPFPLHPTGTLVCVDKDSLLLILRRKGRKCEVKTLLFHKQQSSDPGLGEDPVCHIAEQSGTEKETQTERKWERRVPGIEELDRHRERHKKKLKGRVKERKIWRGETVSSLISPVSLEGAMADNNTHPFVEILESFGLSKIFYHLYTLYKELSLAYTN